MMKLLLSLSLVICLVAANSDVDKSNEIEHKPPINLDPALRRALLKAIEDLEKEPEEISNDESTTEYLTTTEENEILAAGDETDINKEDTTDQVPSIQYHSFVVDGHKAFENDSKPLKTSNENKKQKESVPKKFIDPISDEDIDLKESSNINSFTQTRSIQSNIIADNGINSNIKQSSGKTEVPKLRPTTTTTTTTTTPKPRFNADGENIEELDNHEVQVFQAPLVAAFTVHQDAQGLPRSVVPIYKQAIRRPITPALPVTRMQLGATKPAIGQQRLIEQSLLPQQNIQQQNQIQQHQLLLQQQLEQKQRLLEEQLQKLQNQQRQHEELLRQQHLYQQQQLLYAQKEQQRQQERLIEQEQTFRQQQYLEQQKLIQSQNLVQANQLRQQQQQQQQKNSLPSTTVSFQPSIALSSTNGITEQQTPQREAVDFLVHLRSGHQSPFPLQQNTPLAPNLQLQLPHEKPFTNSFAPKNNQNPGAVRVFRQDSQTGNFGINTNNFFNRNNRFNEFKKNAPFRQQQNGNRYQQDSELKSLLYQSGLAQGGRSQEDFSIITKVLALNHGINGRDLYLNGDRNFLSSESRRQETKVKAGVNGSS